MFIPRFTITPKITRDVEAIGSVFGYFSAIQLPEGYRKELISKVTAEAVHASTAIEGNTLTQQQVNDVLGGKKIHAEDQDIKEIINYNNALEYAMKLAKEERNLLITEKLIKEINKLILKKLRDRDAGKYRTQQVIVGDYLPPEHIKVPVLMREFADWLKNPQPAGLSPILITGIVHYQFVAIHPFIDGNGRTTRILTTLMLVQNDYDMTNFFALESFYNRNRKAYYEALNSADKYRIQGQPDLTRWLEYYVDGMLIEGERAKSRIEEFAQKNKVLGDRVWLSDIQIKMLRLVFEKKAVKIADFLEISNLSRKGTYNAIEKLVQFQLLMRTGEGKGTYYTITEKGLGYA
ncbi:Fic family protein [Patescibacteria group bacterium]|nr:Fic family protein [Patescibacteria group bacterium]MBU4016182.1 Fic family protein [Patescibacteria group bacterium]MBU4099666.1 Fic family protein [Patescibacteria group bacterium]